MAVGLLLASALVAVLPAWVARSGHWKTLLTWTMPELAALVDAQSVTLGWLTPLRCQGLVIRDPSGAPLAEVATLHSDQTLAGLLWHYPDLGTISCDQAQLHLVVRSDGSNLEDFLARLPASRPGARPLKLAATLRDAAVQLDDRVSGRRWECHPLALELVLPGTGQRGSVQWRTSLREQPAVASEPPPTPPAATSPPAPMSGRLVWEAGSGTWLRHLDASAELERFPLAAVKGLLQRFFVEVHLDGAVSLRTEMTWDQTTSRGRLVLQQLQAPSMTIAAPRYLGGDAPTVRLDNVTADLEWVGTNWALKQLDLRSSLAALSAQARWSAAALDQGPSVSPQISSLEGQIQGQLDLAELLRQLPATLHRRPDTELRQGIVEVALSSIPVEGGRQWSGALRTGPLVAVTAGQPVELSQPIELSGTIRQTSQGLVIDQLRGQSSFLALQGEGSLPQGRVQGRLSLDALSAQLQPLFDLGDARLAGTLAGELTWQQIDGGAWAARGQAQLQEWLLAIPGQPPWSEKELTMAARAEGQLEGASLARLNLLELLVRSAADQLELRLTEPAVSLTRQTQLPLAWTIRGELGSWLARAASLVPVRVQQAAGSLMAEGQGRFGLTGGQLQRGTMELTNLVLRTDTLQIQEPTLRAEVVGRWELPTRTFVLDTATLASTALALRADDLHVTGGNPPLRSGMIDLRGDLARLSTWLNPGQQPSPNQFGGSVTGRLELASQEANCLARWSAEVENFVWQRPAPPQVDLRSRTTSPSLRPVLLWHEPRIHLEGQARWEGAASRLLVENLELAASSVLLRGSGTWEEGHPTAPLSWNGELTCDWEALTSQVHWLARQNTPPDRPLPLGLDTLQLRGRHTRPLSVQAALRPAATQNEALATSPVVPGESLTPAGSSGTARHAASVESGAALLTLWSGQASVRWDEARYVGLIAGPADLAARLEAGVLAIGPLDIPLAEGRLRAAPQLTLTSPRPSMRVPAGTLLEGVRISPEMCAQWLKFVAPLVAEATRAEGTLSLNLEGGELPLDLPWDGQLRGTLHVHAAQIGPGPLAQQYLAVARQLLVMTGRQPGRQFEEQLTGRAWLVLPAQQVRFALSQGSVSHEGLTMQVGDLTIVTQGRVHVATQQLDLVASFPLPESWFSNVQGPLAALRGQTIPLPITGTLSRPRVQVQNLEGLGKQLAAGVVEGLLRNALQPASPVDRPDGSAPSSPRGALLPELGRGLERLLGPKSTPSTPTPPPTRLPR